VETELRYGLVTSSVPKTALTAAGQLSCDDGQTCHIVVSILRGRSSTGLDHRRDVFSAQVVAEFGIASVAPATDRELSR
jgi:hypothetical protein